jgi:hypothetical protein
MARFEPRWPRAASWKAMTLSAALAERVVVVLALWRKPSPQLHAAGTGSGSPDTT